jgi:hypothetical protein
MSNGKRGDEQCQDKQKRRVSEERTIANPLENRELDMPGKLPQVMFGQIKQVNDGIVTEEQCLLP